jgi:hypothetical protein
MMVVLPIFAAATEQHSKDLDALEQYVTDELRRLVQQGGAVLLPILQLHVDESAQMIALRQLAENVGADGDPVYDPSHTWRLRMKDGAQPPVCDAQGRKLPKDIAGKVLRARVGNLGGARGREQSSRASLEWSGENRARKAASGQDIYQHRDLTTKPQAFMLTEAVLILRQWGVGVQPKQYLRHRTWRPGEASEDTPQGQDQWLVEEGPVPAPAKGEKDKAA